MPQIRGQLEVQVIATESEAAEGAGMISDGRTDDVNIAYPGAECESWWPAMVSTDPNDCHVLIAIFPL